MSQKIRVVIAKVDDGWLTAPFLHPLLQDPESTGVFPPIHVRDEIDRGLGPAHLEPGGDCSPELLRLGNDHRNGRRVDSTSMNRHAELFGLHLDTRHRGKTLRQLLGQEGQRLSQSDCGRVREGNPRTVDLKASAAGIDDTRHVDADFEIARILSRDDDNSRGGCRHEGHQSATDQQRQPGAARIRHARDKHALIAHEEKQACA